jgi:hypothetical protein
MNNISILLEIRRKGINIFRDMINSNKNISISIKIYKSFQKLDLALGRHVKYP